jgi:DNA-binding response OmpR family regulator
MQVSKVLVVDGDRAAARRARHVASSLWASKRMARRMRRLRDSGWTTDIADVLVLSDELSDGAPSDIIVRGADSTNAAVLVLTRGSSVAVHPNLRRHAATTDRASRVVERIEFLIQERTMRRGAILHFGALSLDMANQRATCGERTVALGHTESRLLAFFTDSRKRCFRASSCLQRLWPPSVRVRRADGRRPHPAPAAGARSARVRRVISRPCEVRATASHLLTKRIM